ncbi:hypothetical protein N657DRAFT_119606 [Parathielavia appendiculata]|uniref:Uncharacterized protein n=1 Tax=Parathielavia appendiculata TaxID=2587402 RepID=A0AAN6Z193_9PEZI|nr:hypothetical protein N657DRAFT_119606 [Parathielavia appendiculata]
MRMADGHCFVRGAGLRSPPLDHSPSPRHAHATLCHGNKRDPDTQYLSQPDLPHVDGSCPRVRAASSCQPPTTDWGCRVTVGFRPCRLETGARCLCDLAHMCIVRPLIVPRTPSLPFCDMSSLMGSRSKDLWCHWTLTLSFSCLQQMRMPITSNCALLSVGGHGLGHRVGSTCGRSVVFRTRVCQPVLHRQLPRSFLSVSMAQRLSISSVPELISRVESQWIRHPRLAAATKTRVQVGLRCVIDIHIRRARWRLPTGRQATAVHGC